MEIKAVIFDLDGTLLDTLGDLTAAVNFALGVKGYPCHPQEKIQSFIGNGVAKLVERAVPKGTSLRDIDETLELFRSYYGDNCANITQPYPGVGDVIEKLHKNGIKTGVFSNKSHRETVKLTEHFFGADVDFSRGSVEGFPRKPDPKGLFLVMEELKVTPGRCIYVGDSQVDVETAANAGIPCIGVAWGFRGRAVLEEAGADIIIETPYDLVDLVLKNPSSANNLKEKRKFC